MEANIEEWRWIPGYEDHYQVSNMGRVYSVPRLNTRGRKVKGRFLSQAKHNSGYLSVILCKDRQRNRFSVHVLVAMAFKNHKPNGVTMVVHHINHDKHDNRAENLEVTTQRINTGLKEGKKEGKYSSIYNNVCFHKATGKFMAQVTIPGTKPQKRKYLGLFKDPYEAYLAAKQYKLDHPDIINDDRL